MRKKKKKNQVMAESKLAIYELPSQLPHEKYNALEMNNTNNRGHKNQMNENCGKMKIDGEEHVCFTDVESHN